MSTNEEKHWASVDGRHQKQIDDDAEYAERLEVAYRYALTRMDEGGVENMTEEELLNWYREDTMF